MDNLELNNYDILEIRKKTDQDLTLVLVLKFCPKHNVRTWHLVCTSGQVVCLECHLENMINMIQFNQAIKEQE